MDLVSYRPPASQGYTVRRCQEEERKKEKDEEVEEVEEAWVSHRMNQTLISSSVF